MIPLIYDLAADILEKTAAAEERPTSSGSNLLDVARLAAFASTGALGGHWIGTRAVGYPMLLAGIKPPATSKLNLIPRVGGILGAGAGAVGGAHLYRKLKERNK